MPTEQQLIEALRKADAAGDVPAAKAIARRIQSMRSAPEKPKSVRGGKPMAETRSDNVGYAPPKKEVRVAAGFDPNKPVSENMQNRFSQDYAGYRALGQHLANLPIAIGQGVANLGGMLPSDTLKANANTYNQYVKQREDTYQAETPDSVASYTGAVVGEVAPWMLGPAVKGMEYLAGAGKIVPQAKGLLRVPAKAARVAVGGGAQGAAAGALTTDTSGDFSNKEEQIKMGAAMGATLPLALLGGAKTVDSIGNAISYARNPERVAGQKLAQFYGSEPDIIAQMRNAQQYFPGEQVSVAQAVPSPRAFAVEKALGNNPEFKIAAEEARNANNAGRMRVVESIAKTPEEMAAAARTRKEATDPFYKEFVNPVSPYTRYNNASQALDAVKGKRMSAEDFDAIDKAGKIVRSVRDGRRTEEEAADLLSQINVKSAGAQKALQQATASVGKNMVDTSRIERELQSKLLHPNTTVRAFAKEQLDFIEQLKGQYGGKIPVANLQGMQQELAKSFNAAASKNNFDKSGNYVLGKLNAKFNNTLERAVPGYKDNSRKYAQLSQPINDMEAGQAILKRPDGRVLNTSGENALSLADLNRAIGDDGKAVFGMSDESLAGIVGLKDSMRREGTALRSAGSDTAYNLNADSWLARQLYGDNSGRSAARDYGLPVLGGFIGEGLGGGAGMAVGSAAGTGLSMALKNRVQAINSRIATETAKGVYDSRVAADMIEQTLRENPKQAEELLKRFPIWRKLLSQE